MNSDCELHNILVDLHMSNPALNNGRCRHRWRREGHLLTDNWVFVDIPHLLLQMDYGVFSPAS